MARQRDMDKKKLDRDIWTWIAETCEHKSKGYNRSEGKRRVTGQGH